MPGSTRTHGKGRWHAVVRQCRIEDELDSIGVLGMQPCEMAEMESTQAMTQAFGVRDATGSFGLAHQRFIANQVYVGAVF